jgi:serine/threonine protein phosphatase PrpC
VKFVTAAVTDTGIKRPENEDSLFTHQYRFGEEDVNFSIICDGMGGLAKGQAASHALVEAFEEWAVRTLPIIANRSWDDGWMKREWQQIIKGQNERIRQWRIREGKPSGTTITAILLTAKRYCIINVGDTRAYEIGQKIRQLTRDHTLVEKEIMLGNLTESQALEAPFRHVLTRCVGVDEELMPDFFFGDTRSDAVYLLCSDGFRHKITSEELERYLQPTEFNTYPLLLERLEQLVSLNKQRWETDNISVIGIKTYDG